MNTRYKYWFIDIYLSILFKKNEAFLWSAGRLRVKGEGKEISANKKDGRSFQTERKLRLQTDYGI